VLAALLLHSPVTVTAQSNSTTVQCSESLHTLPAPAIDEGGDDAARVYKIGVLAIRGFEAAYNEFNRTFSDYLTETAGKRFDPPVRFELKPLNFILLFSDVEAVNVDFIYVNPSAFSCIESEHGANSLVSQISRRVVGGQVYSLTRFGGVIFTRADRDDIQTLEDVREKIAAAASISGLGSGQMQFRELVKKGIAYLQDVKQMVFTSNQGKVVNGVLNGDFDVGYVRTDQIERTKGPDGTLIDKSLLKIIDPLPGLNIDGDPFPFESTTPLYAEWNIAALTHVPDAVAQEVQSAMLQVADHAAVGKALTDCYADSNCDSIDANIFNTKEECEEYCLASIDPELYNRCDTTPELALLANDAKTKGKYSGWRSTLSYMELRNMQEETGFISKDEDTGINRCIRSKEIFDAVTCPVGFFKKPKEQVLNGCADAGLECKEGFQCLCKPCVQAFDVDVFPSPDESELPSSNPQPCGRFMLCGNVEQRETIKFTAVDNKKRDDLKLKVTLFEGQRSWDVIATSNGDYSYTFEVDAEGSRTGSIILQMFMGEEQISVSPLRLQVSEPDCGVLTGDDLREPNDLGECVCEDGSTEIGGNCVSLKILLPSILVPLFILMLVGVYLYVELKRKQADSVWAVLPDELEFDDPPEIIGRGTFGLVLLAEYRGTEVAVKRVIPPRVQKQSRRKSQKAEKMVSLLGEGDDPDMPIAEFEFEVFDDEQSAAMTAGPADSGKDAGAEPSDIESGGTGSTSMSTNGFANNSVSNRFGKKNASENELPTVVERRNSMLSDTEHTQEQPPEPEPRKPAVRRGSATGSVKSVGSVDSVSERGGRLRRASFAESTGSSAGDSTSKKSAAAAAARRSSFFDFENVDGGGDRRGSGTRASLSSRTGRDSTGSVGSLEDNSSKDGVSKGDSYQRSLGMESAVSSIGMVSGGLNKDITQAVHTDKSDSTGKFDGRASGSGNLALRSGSMSGTQSMSIKSAGKRKSLKERILGSGDEYAKLKEEFMIEMRYLSKLRHPCITTVMGAVVDKRHEPMLVMEYMDHGSLYDLLHNDSMVIEGEIVLPILRDIAQGVRFLHAANPQVIHGDLKAQNVLVDSKFRAKVADFGLSQKRRVGATGTPLWMAPELLRGESENTSMSDVYSFGIILYEVYSRSNPYEGEDHLEVLRLVADKKVNKRPPVPKACPNAIASLMADCLVESAEARPSFEELDLRLKRLDVENVEPGAMNFSMQSKKDQMADRNQEILFEVFPRHVAEALRDGRKVEPESKEIVTVFFSDIVGFTTLCSQIDAVKVSDMLDRLYSRFDGLATLYDVFKIETIGDAYMAVTNLAKDQADDHAKRMAQFAIGAEKAASETLIDMDNPSMGTVVIRVGFHSGPIVANVVGTRLPKYTIFGDTVNTSSRMESNSHPRRIQVSERTANLIKVQCPEIKLLYRGEIHVKGKGEMKTYWVNEEAVQESSRTLLAGTGKPDQNAPPKTP